MTDNERSLECFYALVKEAEKVFEKQKIALSAIHGENLLMFELTEKTGLERCVVLHTKVKTIYGLLEARSDCSLRMSDGFPDRLAIVEENIVMDEKAIFSIELRPDGYRLRSLDDREDQISYHASFYCEIAFRLCKELTKINGWEEEYFPAINTDVFPSLPVLKVD